MTVTRIRATPLDAEEKRLEESRRREKHWKRWGPYLSERAWGTVREDYSPGGTAWDDLPHDHARSRAYRWNEDGIAGISDRRQTLCFALAMWNGVDPILKERLFGLTGQEGNHGEDCKELYWYLDSTPTHSFMRMLYKYPQRPYPYEELIRRNREAGRGNREVELLDTGALDGDRYFDVQVEYAKADVEDILVRIQVSNRGPETAHLHLLPTLWFRNTWSWGAGEAKPRLEALRDESGRAVGVRTEHRAEGSLTLRADAEAEWLFTENETNSERLWGTPNASPWVKDAFHARVIEGRTERVNPAQVGTKSAAWIQLTVLPGATRTIRLRLTRGASSGSGVGEDFEAIFSARAAEADAFYRRVIPAELSDDGRNVMRQALGGMLWSKQFYHYVVRDWLEGDPRQPPPPDSRKGGRNSDWGHLHNADVLSMPDKWEYP
ncbi:MAG TPA: glucosidase, partial [Myxococcaceae bacterium]|nr:glucosidase [Myxococcaceae bacterium]